MNSEKEAQLKMKTLTFLLIENMVSILIRANKKHEDGIEPGRKGWVGTLPLAGISNATSERTLMGNEVLL